MFLSYYPFTKQILISHYSLLACGGHRQSKIGAIQPLSGGCTYVKGLQRYQRPLVVLKLQGDERRPPLFWGECCAFQIPILR